MAILLDMRENMSAWQENESDSAEGWIIRRTLVLDALLAPVLYLEQMGDPITADDLMSLSKLESVIGKACFAHGPKFELVATKLRRVLQSLPDYKAERFGAQSIHSIEHYDYIAMGYRNLRACQAVR